MMMRAQQKQPTAGKLGTAPGMSGSHQRWSSATAPL
jgi:hypothetical protein